MRTSLQTNLFMALGLVLAIPGMFLMAQVAIDPSFDIAIRCGLLFTWSALASIFCLIAGLICAACDCFTQ